MDSQYSAPTGDGSTSRPPYAQMPREHDDSVLPGRQFSAPARSRLEANQALHRVCGELAVTGTRFQETCAAETRIGAAS